MASIWDNVFGSDSSIQRVPTVTKDIRGLLQNLGGLLGPALQQQGQQLTASPLNYNQNAPQGYNFAPTAQEARTNFMQQTIPALAERFNALGAFGGSGFRNAALNQAQLLDQNLASQQAKYDFLGNEQNINNYFRGQQMSQQDRANQMNMLSSLLGQLLGTQQFANVTKEGQIGLLPATLPALGRAGVGYAFGGPAGAMSGLTGGFANEVGRQLAGS